MHARGAGGGQGGMHLSIQWRGLAWGRVGGRYQFRKVRPLEKVPPPVNRAHQAPARNWYMKASCFGGPWRSVGSSWAGLG